MALRLKIMACVAMIGMLIIQCKHDPFPVGDINPDLPPTSGPDTTQSKGQECDKDTIYFENTILPLLRSRCALSGCHDDQSAEDGVVLTSYSNVINTADVRAFDLDGSDLYEVITESDPVKRMPRPPNDPLSQDQVELIADWINQGAKNNSCTACDTTNTGFSSAVLPLIRNKCTGCHSGNTPSGAITLTNHANISSTSLSGNLLAAIKHQTGITPMPFNGPMLPGCEIAIIEKWIENGALDN